MQDSHSLKLHQNSKAGETLPATQTELQAATLRFFYAKTACPLQRRARVLRDRRSVVHRAAHQGSRSGERLVARVNRLGAGKTSNRRPSRRSSIRVAKRNSLKHVTSSKRSRKLAATVRKPFTGGVAQLASIWVRSTRNLSTSVMATLLWLHRIEHQVHRHVRH